MNSLTFEASLFKPNTLIVLGAASSFDFGFPLGRDLKAEIAELLRFSTDDFGRARSRGEDQARLMRDLDSPGSLSSSLGSDAILRAAQMVADGVGLSSSIDSFLEMRREDDAILHVAKAAITQIIPAREYACAKLWGSAGSERNRPNFDGMWHQEFAQICFDRTSVDELPEALRRFSVVNFNYDRTFERFLCIAMHLLYSVKLADAEALASSVAVTHPYGYLGSLFSAPGDQLRFGEGRHMNSQYLADRIRTFSEGGSPGGTLKQVQKQVADADRIIFLGFGFHQQNIEMLTPPDNGKDKIIIGTAKGISPRAIEDIKRNIRVAFGVSRSGRANKAITESQVSLEDKDCRMLLEENRHLLIDSTLRRR